MMQAVHSEAITRNNRRTDTLFAASELVEALTGATATGSDHNGTVTFSVGKYNVLTLYEGAVVRGASNEHGRAVARALRKLIDIANKKGGV